jgi:hypothetical protein
MTTPDRNGVTHPKYGTCMGCRRGFEVDSDGFIPLHTIDVVAGLGSRLVEVECRGSRDAYNEYADRCAEQRHLKAEARRKKT